ncbi:hypothetical protein GX441_04695 [bacterium]|nr:hypothetical protein [bacterium]
MQSERLHLKIKALFAMGEAVKAAEEVLNRERIAGTAGHKLDCIVEHVEKMQALYDECIECCLDDINE